MKDLGEYREAITVLEKSERYDNERTDIYNLMGLCHFKSKDHEKAIECFREVLRIDLTFTIDFANIASNYGDMGKRDLAIRYCQFLLELDPTIESPTDNLRRLQQ